MSTSRTQLVPSPRSRAPRALAGAILGAEAGAAAGLLFFGDVPFAPLGLAAAGALTGPLAGEGVVRLRSLLAAHWLRKQLRQAHPPEVYTAKR